MVFNAFEGGIRGQRHGCRGRRTDGEGRRAIGDVCDEDGETCRCGWRIFSRLLSSVPRTDHARSRSMIFLATVAPSPQSLTHTGPSCRVTRAAYACVSAYGTCVGSPMTLTRAWTGRRFSSFFTLRYARYGIAAKRRDDAAN